MKRSNGVFLFLGLITFLVGYGTETAAAPSGTLQVAFLNVGEGDSILLRDDSNFDVLIDGGQPAAGATVVAYLRQQHIDDIDVMVSTHADSDHTGGLIKVLEMTDIPVRAVYYNGYAGSTTTWNDFVTAVNQEGLSLNAMQFSSAYSWGSMTAQALNPSTGLSAPDQNDASVVLLVNHGSVKYLFTGDISSSAEAIVAGRGVPITAQIMKVAHHGSNYSSSTAFLSVVQPKEAVIGVGTNAYGHPGTDTLGRLTAVGARIWRTDVHGTVVITDNGTTYTTPTNGNYSIYLPMIRRNN